MIQSKNCEKISGKQLSCGFDSLFYFRHLCLVKSMPTWSCPLSFAYTRMMIVGTAGTGSGSSSADYAAKDPLNDPVSHLPERLPSMADTMLLSAR